MADFSLGGFGAVESTGTNGASGGIVVTASGTNHTKGSWVELLASTADESDWIVITISDLEIGVGSSQGFLIDIGIGAAASEEVIVANISESAVQVEDDYSPAYFSFPLRVPAGSRISARCQVSDGSVTSSVSIICHLFTRATGSPVGSGETVTYGADTATSLGTPVDAGGTVNTPGSWVEFTDDSDELKGFFLMVGGNANTSLTDADGLIHVGLGGIGSEETIVANIPYLVSSTEIYGATQAYLPLKVPAGERIAIRCQMTINNATDRIIDVVMIGVK